jgi:hypothetical protein
MKMLRMFWANHCSLSVLGAETSQRVTPPTSPADSHCASPADVVSCIEETARMRKKKKKNQEAKFLQCIPSFIESQ